MATLRAGLVGLGMMGRHHARVLHDLAGVELVAVADPAGDPHGAGRGLTLLAGIDEVIATGVDYCVVAVPTGCHREVGLALAEAGVPALIEKPLAEDVTSALAIADAFVHAGVLGAVGHVERYNSAVRSLRARLAHGELGRVYQVATRRQGPFPSRVADVGVVKDLATHDIDLTAWAVQQPFRWVGARAAVMSGREQEDLVAVVGQMADGTVTNHLVNWLSPFKERVTVVTGERGAFVADTLAADLTFFANADVPTTWDGIAQFRGVSEGDVVRYAIPKPEPLRTEHEAFRDALLGEPADIVTMQQGVAIVQVAEAVLESARTGQMTEVPTDRVSFDATTHPAP
jgi:predicted dehydrogenase